MSKKLLLFVLSLDSNSLYPRLDMSLFRAKQSAYNFSAKNADDFVKNVANLPHLRAVNVVWPSIMYEKSC